MQMLTFTKSKKDVHFSSNIIHALRQAYNQSVENKHFSLRMSPCQAFVLFEIMFCFLMLPSVRIVTKVTDLLVLMKFFKAIRISFLRVRFLCLVSSVCHSECRWSREVIKSTFTDRTALLSTTQKQVTALRLQRQTVQQCITRETWFLCLL